MASGSKQPTVEDYFSDDSAHGNEGIEHHSASSPDLRRAPSPTSQASDRRSDSGYASTAADLRDDSYTHATYRRPQNIVHNGVSSTKECTLEEEERSSQHRPREVEAKPAQLLNKRLPRVVHSRSVPEVIVENRTRRLLEKVYPIQPSHGITGRRSPPAAWLSSYITQRARDISTSRPSIRRGSYPERPEVEISIQSAQDSRSVEGKKYRIEPRVLSLHKLNGEYLSKADHNSDKIYPDQSSRDANSGPMISRWLSESSETEFHPHKKDENRLWHAEDEDKGLPAHEAGMAELIISGRGTRSSYMRDKLRSRTAYMRKEHSRDGQQPGISNQSQMTVTQDDGEIVDDTSNAKIVARTTGARCEGSVIDSQLGTQNHTDDITERHILRNEVENIGANWKDVWNMIPEVWKWDLGYHTVHRTGSTRHGCWTCTPLESDEPKLYPLTIASAPVVLPVEYQWPPAAGPNPPPDPRPSIPIDCSKELPLDIIRDLFLTFEGSVGFYILISGLIQVIVPDDFDLVRENPTPSIALKHPGL
jgi:hypothetical protein